MNDKTKQKPILDYVQNKQDEYNESIMKSYTNNSQVMLNMIKQATGSAHKGRHIPRLAFTENPLTYDHYAGVYKLKKKLLPDTAIKEIRVQNMLVAAILRARGNTLSMMGHIRKDRFDVGIECNIKSEFKDYIEPEQLVKIQERIDQFLKKLISCGYTQGLDEEEKTTLSEFLDIQSRNGLSFGRFATEIIRDEDGDFHRFRVADVGTLYQTVKKGEVANNIRQSSLKLLEQLTGEQYNIDLEKFKRDEYAWVQVIDGMPRQSFAPDEMLVYNLYPSSDVEHNGYPVTPLDTITASITTFMSIETYNRLYFQNGRGTRGMVVINSDEIDQAVIEDIKQQFNASINNVQNSFRTPIFGVSKEDAVQWMPMVSQKKDGEFQFLYDQVARNILSAFNMSPDELPGYAHLSRGTNQQSLSESNNEYKLIAARDTGIRPLLLKFQDFFNEKLFPIIDPELSQLCYISLSGLDAETKQQESVRLQQDMPIHYDYDSVMEEVEKEPIGEYIGGRIPFNEFIRQIFDTYIETGKVIGEFNNSPAAFVDPLLKYKRDQFWFQNIQILSEFNPAAVQAYYATRKDAYQMFQMLLSDYLDEEQGK